MDDGAIATVRRFNRLVTQRVGALDDRFLARDRPLGEARVLWEVGAEGCEVRALRLRLDLDSGYLSRLLRSLEGAGLVTVEQLQSDGRVRMVRLTEAGDAERAILEERSDQLAASLLAPLGRAQQDRLVAAMTEVERLLTAGMVTTSVLDPSDPAAAYCLGEYFGELDRRFEGGFDPALSRLPDAESLRPPHGLLVVAFLHDAPIGCGALKFDDTKPTEIKRMWVSASARGLGIGRRLLEELEGRAAALGSRSVRLETNKALTEAINLYRASGYVEVDAFNDERYGDHWFEKQFPL
jgi:DNA-binding MarR family transcriptional regulator/GNAT superfamily N-acetyltransferase